MLALWIILLLGSFAITIFASKRAVKEVRQVVVRIGLPSFFVGLTLVAIGTDLPEIANSIVASMAGRGDLNAGDSIGSAVTQLTLVMGLLPFIVGAFRVGRDQVVVSGLLTVGALLLGSVLVADDFLSRADGLVLVTSWLIATALVWKYSPSFRQRPLKLGAREEGGSILLALLMFAFVGLGAAGAVLAFVKLSEALGVPEYLISFFAGAIGTSLPELVVDTHAIRSKSSALAAGDLFGSSLIDATLSLGVGPLFFATAVTGELAVRGALTGAGVILAVTLLFSRVEMNDRRSGLLLILFYLIFYPILLF